MDVVVGWYGGRCHMDWRVRWRCAWLGYGQVRIFLDRSEYSMCGTGAINVWWE